MYTNDFERIINTFNEQHGGGSATMEKFYIREYDKSGTKVDDVFLIVFSNNKAMRLTTEADCCSETWFADFYNVTNLKGRPIKSIINVEINQDTLHFLRKDIDGRCRQDSDSFYGIKIKADRGYYCDIVYRNSSNGYYGGSIGSIEICDLSALNLNEYKEITTNDYQS